MRCNIDDFNWGSFTYQELACFPKYLAMYDQEFEKLETFGYDMSIYYGRSIDELYYILEELENKDKSTYLFPGDTVYFYPFMEVVKASRKHTCYASGAEIYPGSEYVSYKAFLYNKTKHQSYVTPTMDFEVGSFFECPKTLEEFELFCSRLDVSYESSFDVEYNILTSLHGPILRILTRHK